ncbi:MAG: sugar phosphate isomerase/epimerase [Anaerolineae bacterium]|jgi:sugar phosphate isomerase/epimerase|nr:sugar phosphate isomerase/epimerase [Anaerolineae bacterium]
MIGLQLYTVRDALAQDFEGTIRKIAAMGYEGVETAGMFGESPQSAAALFRSLGLKVIGAHSPLPLGDDAARVVETLGILGTDLAICPWLPPEEYYQSLAGVQRVVDLLNEADASARRHGLRLMYHNHDFEFLPLADGTLPLLYLLEHVAPTVLFEIDTYWVKTAGQDVVAMLERFGDRAQLLHIKDGPAVRGRPMLALGEGVMDFAPIVAASRAAALVVELDECATDMLTAVETSYRYLKGLVDGQAR